MTIDPDSFRGQLILNIIDKIILGTISAVVLLGFQNFWNSYQDDNNQKIAILNFNSDMLVEQRKGLFLRFQNYLELINKHANTGNIPKSDIKDRERLKNLSAQIELLATSAVLMSNPNLNPSQPEESQEAEKKFLGSIFALQSSMLYAELSETEIEDEKKKVMDGYRNFQIFLNKSILNNLQRKLQSLDCNV